MKKILDITIISTKEIEIPDSAFYVNKTHRYGPVVNKDIPKNFKKYYTNQSLIVAESDYHKVYIDNGFIKIVSKITGNTIFRNPKYNGDQEDIISYAKMFLGIDENIPDTNRNCFRYAIKTMSDSTPRFDKDILFSDIRFVRYVVDTGNINGEVIEDEDTITIKVKVSLYDEDVYVINKHSFKLKTDVMVAHGSSAIHEYDFKSIEDAMNYVRTATWDR